jgi:hypothetical protein
MGGWMACCHQIFIKRKKERKKDNKNKKTKTNDIVSDKYINAFKLGAN